ncbi:uncharacterized protein LOC120179258 [Hibiscus syriacus]|uniref:uncharacterized protein LOC120179258 n=1 Tax=Hibiscus syriacus TaxID=106335 RepID=UPI0019224ECD|nr:uncharacterized protein LOC120179258 [Hibiscus syriacus]
MAVQAQLYSDNIGFPLCGSLDLIDNNGCGFNQYGLSVQQLYHLNQLQQEQQQFQYIRNQQQRNQNLESRMFSQNEIDQFIKSQNERLRLLLQEQRNQQFEVLVKKMESRVCVLLREKDEEIAKATNKANELQNLLKRVEMDSEVWQRVAHENEAMVFYLNNRIEQLREQACSRVDDAESCCECEEEQKKEEWFANAAIIEVRAFCSFRAGTSVRARNAQFFLIVAPFVEQPRKVA